MKNEKVEMIENGLKCDNENCDFTDKNIKSVDYENWIDAPCPKCGENLLTKEDFVNIRTLEMVVALTNSMTEEEVNELTKNIDHKKLDFMKDISVEDLNKKFSVKINTHKNITFENAKVLKDQ